MKRLVFPDPILAKNLISWELAVTRIAEGSKEAAEAVTSRHLPGAELHSDMNIRVQVMRELQTGERETTFRMAMFGAAATRELTVFVKKPLGAEAWMIHPHLWRGTPSFAADPVRLALTGRFAVVREFLPNPSVEADLAGNDLFVEEAEFKTFCKQAGSLKQREAAGKKIVQTFIDNHPGEKLTFPEFMKSMRSAFPTASAREVGRVWRSVRQNEWVKGGRPSGVRS